MQLRKPALKLPGLLRRKKSDKSADGTMSLMEHLFELRRRLFFGTLGILLGTIVGLIIICLFLFTNWRKLLQEKKFTISFNIWK